MESKQACGVEKGPKESSETRELKEGGWRGEVRNPRGALQNVWQTIMSNVPPLLLFFDGSCKWQDFLLLSWIVAGMGSFLYCSVFLETDEFLLKASKLHVNLIKDMKQTALKVI